MIHNGIEYADMQIISETYDFLSKGMGYSELESAKVFKEWSSSELSSFLIDISVSVLEYLDKDTKQPLVSLILDRAEQKGTGRLAAIAALELGVAAPSISESVSARILSSKKQERVSSSKIYKKPEAKHPYLDIVDMKKALLAAKISSYAQGFDVLSAANKEFDWDMSLADIAKNWRAGCIIRADFLDEVAEAFRTETKLANLIMAPHFSSILKDSIPSLRRVVKWAITKGIPSPVLSASLSYFDTYTSLNLPANLIQGQRDYFGSHGFERVDKAGYYTNDWNQ
jgi:6-phosphogluconate dehydrogenase